METKLELHIHSVSDIPGAAKEFLDTVGHRKVFAFDAEMGAGKTTFILGLLSAMGVKNPEGSPTYSLVNVYDCEMFGKVYHFDFYRIKNEEEAYDIGAEEMLYSDGVCFIEWPEKIKNLLPENTIWSYIRINEDNTRTLTVEL
jgi:tRNA threonylcarbamoyladenosine biosynthesis protein TsaE